MKRVALLCIGFLGLSFITTAVCAGESGTYSPHQTYNPNALYPIPEENILIKDRIWRHIDLKEKSNKSFFAHENEITKFIIEGVKTGLLTAYSDEAFTNPMTQEAFFEKLKLPEADYPTEEEKSLGFTDDNDWQDKAEEETGTKREKPTAYFLPNEVSILELMEDLIFDKVRSIQIYDIQAVKLIIPADKFETGLYREIGIFKYKDLAAYFDDKKVSWINVHNGAGHIKMTEAFALRLFSSRIVKLENPDDNTIADLYNSTPKEASLASRDLEERLLEKEYFLWEP
jgi:gliding motility associated protien GldN